MVRVIFILICGFMLGALVIEYKQLFSNSVAIPVAFLPDGGQYDGELLKGELNDSGRIVWPNGDYYEGEFSNGLFHGYGLYRHGGEIYEGEFVNGVAQGKGVIEYADGRRYEGDVVKGLPDGHGTMTLVDGEYVGEFREGVFQGIGTLQNKNGNRYEGEFANDQFNGQGTYTSADGKLFHGLFRDNAINGQGEYRDDDARYSGGFRQWLFDGKGVYENADFRYEGEFLEGEFHGVGEYQNKNSELTYKGDFVNGVYHGEGTLMFQSNRYEGAFEYGVKHGEGVLTYIKPLDGISQVKGTWRYDELIESDNPLVEHDASVIVEHVLYQQPALLAKQLSALDDNDPDQTELYFVGVAGDGEQGVFRREVNFIKAQFDRDYDTENKSALLINSDVSWQKVPLATVTSIEKLLSGVAQKMDAEQDILFIYFTSHGSADFNFQLQQPGLQLGSLSAEKMGEIIRQLPVKYKVVVVSACYAGGYVKPLKDDNTLIIVAASEDKTSFGCSDTANMTYFGEAFFKDALPQSDSFVTAFDRAREIVRGREAKEGFDYSNPLIFRPKAIVSHLQRWRDELAERKKQQNRLLPTPQ